MNCGMKEIWNRFVVVSLISIDYFDVEAISWISLIWDTKIIHFTSNTATNRGFISNKCDHYCIFVTDGYKTDHVLLAFMLLAGLLTIIYILCLLGC